MDCTFSTAVGLRVVLTVIGHVVDAQQLVDGGGEIGSESDAVVGDYDGRVPMTKVLAASLAEISATSTANIWARRLKWSVKSVGVPTGGEGQRSDNQLRRRCQEHSHGHGEHGPPDGWTRRLASLADQAHPNPPANTVVHINPLIEAFDHPESTVYSGGKEALTTW